MPRYLNCVIAAAPLMTQLKCKPTCRVSLLRSRTMIAQSAWRDQSSEDSEIKTLGRKIDVETLSFENG